jgi:hypothetical protein
MGPKQKHPADQPQLTDQPQSTGRPIPNSRPDIEAMVRETLARLVAQRAERNKSATMSDRGNIPNLGEKLAITERLITSAMLHGRLAGVSTCVVPPRAVVTPAAKDLLRDRAVTLSFAGTEAGQPAEKIKDAARRLLLAVAEATFDLAPLAAALGRDGMTTQRTAKTGLLAAIDAVCAAMSGAGQRADCAVLFTRETPAAVCLANRVRGVRAAAAASAREARNAVRSVGANVLMVDPAERSFWELLQIGKAFTAGGPRPCPSLWIERLS